VRVIGGFQGGTGCGLPGSPCFLLSSQALWSPVASETTDMLLNRNDDQKKEKETPNHIHLFFLFTRSQLGVLGERQGDGVREKQLKNLRSLLHTSRIFIQAIQ
jgi:hypothetical protein